MDQRITSNFGAFTPAKEVVAGRDLSGLTAVVTGGASGIGLETARALADARAEVVLAVRNADAGRRAAQELGGRVSADDLDLSDLSSVRGFAERWSGRPLHVLINNAGVMACPLAYTGAGLEMQVGTNHFGHYLLTVLLADALERGAQESGRPSRVVQLSSAAHLRAGVDFEDMHYRSRPYEKWNAYAQSKSANSLFALGFDARWADRGVRANALHPGGIMTPLQRHLPREEMIAMGWMDEAGKVTEGFKTPEQGASTSVWAAVGPELENVGGLYLEDCAQAQPWPGRGRSGVRVEHALDPEQAERLWTISAQTMQAG